MQGSFDGMKTGLQNFRRYVPADLVSQLVGQKQDALLGGVSRQLTILFSDIANFTSISEHLEPQVLVQDLCEYFNVISRASRSNSICSALKAPLRATSDPSSKPPDEALSKPFD